MSLSKLSNSNSSKRRVSLPVTVEISSDAELATIQELFKDYIFVGEGLIDVGEKLRKGDFITTAATRNFIKKA